MLLCFFLEKNPNSPDCVQWDFLRQLRKDYMLWLLFCLMSSQYSQRRWSWSSLFVRRSSSCSSGKSDNLIFTGSGSSVQVPIRKNGRQLTSQKELKTKFSGKDYAAGLWSVIKLPELQVPSKTASDLKPAYWIRKLHRKTMKPIANFVITD